MTFVPIPLTNQEAAAYKPLPKEGSYRVVSLPGGGRAVLIQGADKRWQLIPDKEIEQPLRPPPALKKGA